MYITKAKLHVSEGYTMYRNWGLNLMLIPPITIQDFFI